VLLGGLNPAPTYHELIRPTLNVKFIDGPKIGQSFTFNSEEAEVKIGRLADCQIRFDETGLSRHQTTFRFDRLSGWMLCDGDGARPSTNGTWLLVEEAYEVRTGLVFKSGSSLFRVKAASA
jgi:hypothetical protein